MLAWLQDHTAAITAVTSLISVLIWLVYAQLLYQNYRRQRRPKIIISQVGERNIDSLCLLSNMSQEAIYIECVQLLAHTEEHSACVNITDFVDQLDGDDMQIVPGSGTYQGPLASGNCLTLGSFKRMTERLLIQTQVGDNKIKKEDIKQLTVRIVATYGPENRPVGAFRTFLLETDEQSALRLYPERVYTGQYRHFYNRRRAARWLKGSY